jgi:hypothetical protein
MRYDKVFAKEYFIEYTMNAPLRARASTSINHLDVQTEATVIFFPLPLPSKDEHPPVRPQCCRRC